MRIKIKKIIKKFKVASYFNKKLKCFWYEYQWKLLGSYYSEKKIDDNVIIPKFKNNGKPLLLIYIGTDYDQDFSGFAQCLKTKFSNVEFFYSSDGTYGQNFVDHNNEKVFYNKSVRKNNGIDLINLIRDRIIDHNIVLLGQMLNNYMDLSALQFAKKNDVYVINISMDDKIYRNWKVVDGKTMGAIGLASCVDLTVTTTKEVVNWYRAHKYCTIYKALGSYKKLFYSAVDNERDIDVLFIGNKYGQRGEFIDFLINNGVNVSAWGGGWENGYASFEKSIELSARSKIIIGFGFVGHTKNLCTIKLRDFDAPLSGALYITQDSDVIRDVYSCDEVVLYKNKEECLNLIIGYLANNKRRLEIAKKGQDKVLECYLWDDYLDDLFQITGIPHIDKKNDII
ncbi:TPA: glycosyltransferase family protein [Photobacterium damselae]